MSEWDQLLAIRKEAIAEFRADRRNPPVACPNDGEPLTSRGDGKLRCRFDGWEWPTDPNPLFGEH